MPSGWSERISGQLFASISCSIDLLKTSAGLWSWSRWQFFFFGTWLGRFVDIFKWFLQKHHLSPSRDYHSQLGPSLSHSSTRPLSISDILQHGKQMWLCLGTGSLLFLPHPEITIYRLRRPLPIQRNLWFLKLYPWQWLVSPRHMKCNCSSSKVIWFIVWPILKEGLIWFDI